MAQSKPQAVPLHVVRTAPVGNAHGVHELPHVLGELFETQNPLQSWVDGPQGWPQAALPSTHAPWQTFLPSGHFVPQAVPSQVASPPVGTGHGMQDDPHVATSLFDTHLLPHK